MIPIPVHAANPGPMTGDGNWTYLVPGRVTTLIDAGTGAPQFLDALHAALDGRELDQVLVTHGHTDHASGAPAIAARYPRAVFRKHPWAERDARWPLPWTRIDEGDRIAVGDVVVEAVHTPGHAPDHMAFWHDGTRTLFGGDLAIRGTTVYIPSRGGGDLRQYLASLGRVIGLAPARILPAHGAPIDDPVETLETYIRHRMTRERQLVEILREAPATPEAIAHRIYKGLGPAYMPYALDSVLAHLHKLEAERRAGRAGEAWHIMDA